MAKGSLLASLDELASDGDFPWWDDAKRMTVAMRLTGFAGPSGPALVIESVAYVPAEAALERVTFAFGAVDEPGRIGRDWLTEDDAFHVNVDDQTILVKATGVRMRPSRGLATPATIDPPRLTIKIRGRKYQVDVSLSGAKPRGHLINV